MISWYFYLSPARKSQKLGNHSVASLKFPVAKIVKIPVGTAGNHITGVIDKGKGCCYVFFFYFSKYCSYYFIFFFP